jgi:hypothetical protein
MGLYENLFGGKKQSKREQRREYLAEAGAAEASWRRHREEQEAYEKSLKASLAAQERAEGKRRLAAARERGRASAKARFLIAHPKKEVVKVRKGKGKPGFWHDLAKGTRKALAAEAKATVGVLRQAAKEGARQRREALRPPPRTGLKSALAPRNKYVSEWERDVEAAKEKVRRQGGIIY